MASGDRAAAQVRRHEAAALRWLRRRSDRRRNSHEDRTRGSMRTQILRTSSHVASCSPSMGHGGKTFRFARGIFLLFSCDAHLYTPLTSQRSPVFPDVMIASLATDRLFRLRYWGRAFPLTVTAWASTVLADAARAIITLARRLPGRLARGVRPASRRPRAGDRLESSRLA